MSNKNYVVEIYLASNNLRGALEPFIWNLTKLSKLNLQGNELTGLLTDFLPQKVLPIQSLVLKRTKIFGPVPWKTLAGYENLTMLEIGHTKLNGTIDKEIGNLFCLQVLTIEATKIRGRLPTSIKQLTNLYAIDFSFLQLKGSLNLFYAMSKLKFALLENNELTGQLPYDFASRFKKLELFEIAHNQLSGTLPKNVQFPPSLKVIDIRRNGLQGEIPTSMLRGSYVYYIDFSRNQFTKFATHPTETHLPAIETIDFSHNPFQGLNTTRLQHLFIPKICKEHDYDRCKTKKNGSILTFNFESTRLSGTLEKLLWYGLEKMVAIRLANNSLEGRFPYLTQMQYNIQTIDFSNNSLNGYIPEDIHLLPRIKEINLQGNPKLKPKSRMQPLPKIARPSNTTMQRNENLSYQCPQIILTPTNGVLDIDSDYYGKQYCECLPGFYGLNGHCRKCPNHADCSHGDARNSSARMHENAHPIPSPENMTDLIQCNSVYADTYPCNPTGRCTCWLDESGTRSWCDSSCICGGNATGRLCSQCKKGFYHDGHKCQLCQSVSRNRAIIGGIVAAATGLCLTTWIINRVKGSCTRVCTPKLVKFVTILTFVVLSAIVVCFGFFHLIPGWMTEVYCSLLLLAAVARLKTIHAFVFISIMYVQVLNSLNVTSLEVKCKYCTFASTLTKLRLFTAAKWIKNLANLNFYELSCSIPVIYSPVGRLLFLVFLPLAGGTVGYFACLVDYRIKVMTSKLHNRRQEQNRFYRKANRKAKEYLLLLLNIFYFPIASCVIKLLLPCETNPHLPHPIMKAYPWMDCSSTEYNVLFAIAIIVTVAYIAFIPLLFLCLLRRRNTLPPGRSESATNILFSSYKKPFQKFMTVLLMFRRLSIALVVSVFPHSQKDVQAIPFNLIVLGFAFYIAAKKPFQSFTRWNLESWADVGASLTIVVTYNCMTNRTDASETAEVAVLASNVVFILFIVVSSLIHFWKAFKEKTFRYGEN